MNIPKLGLTLQQQKYALDNFAGGKTKQEIALNCGYAPSVARNAKNKIESTKGYKNAILDILEKSDHVVLNLLATFERRGFDEFSNKDLVNALSSLSAGWSKFSEVGRPKQEDPMDGHNKLRTIVMQRIENQTITTNGNEAPTVREAQPIVETNDF